MNKLHNREKQAAVLHHAQQQRKQQKKEQVLKAVQQLQTDNQPLTFPNIARVAGCSVSYLYKWSEITAYIHDLQNQETHQLHHLEEKQPAPHSLKTLHEVSKQRIQELLADNRNLKRQNEKLRGYVAEIFEFREECERLRTQLRQLNSPSPSTKIVPIQTISKKTAQVSANESSDEITQLIQQMGIKLGVKLKREIAIHDPEKVKNAILAFGQYRSQTPVNNPGACLLVMIRDEAEPNIPHKPITLEEDEFERWYQEAISVGFCQDLPKNYLTTQQGQVMVRVFWENSPAGYELMPWRDAKARMESSYEFTL